MSNMGLNAGSRVTLVTETHVISCTIQSVRLREPCDPYTASVEQPTDSGRYQPRDPCYHAQFAPEPCGQDTPVHLTPPQEVSPCADPPCEPCSEPSTCKPGAPCGPCGAGDAQSTLAAQLAEQATERLNADEFEVALETGVAIKRN